jgi:hypothetical protein
LLWVGTCTEYLPLDASLRGGVFLLLLAVLTVLSVEGCSDRKVCRLGNQGGWGVLLCME